MPAHSTSVEQRRAARRAALVGEKPSVPQGGLRAAAMSGSRWAVLQQFGSRFTTIVVFLVLARLLPPHSFGLVALASVFIALLQVIVEGGFGQAIIQRREIEPGHVDTVFWISVGMGTLLAGLLSASAGPLGSIYGEPQLAPVLRVLALAVVISSLSAAQAALLRRNLLFKRLALLAVAANIAGGIAGLLVALLGGGVWALVAQYVALTTAQTCLLWVATGWRPGGDVSSRYFTDVFAFSRNTLGSSLLAFTNQRSDDFLVGSWLGSTALGLYTVGYRLQSIMQDLVTQVLLTVAFPVFSRLQGDRERLGRAYRSVLRLGAGISFPAYLFFVVEAHDIIRVFFGAKWDAAASVMRLLAVFGALQTTLAITDNCLVASGRPHISFRNRLANTVVQVCLMAVAARYGIDWVAASLIARAYLMAPLPVWALRRAGITNFGIYLGSLVVPVVSSLVMIAALQGIRLSTADRLSPLAHLVVAVPVGALVYLGLLALLDRTLLRDVLSLARPGGKAALRRRTEARPPSGARVQT